MPGQFIFFYGTLRSDKVFKAVTGKELNASKATLNDYQIYSLKDRMYPAIIPSKGNMVDGLIVEVSENTLERLDWFEGNEYERKTADVVLSNGIKNQAFVYVLRRDQHDLLTEEGWDFDNFVLNDLEYYLS